MLHFMAKKQFHATYMYVHVQYDNFGLLATLQYSVYSLDVLVKLLWPTRVQSFPIVPSLITLKLCNKVPCSCVLCQLH
jgi:hypothetical protein